MRTLAASRRAGARSIHLTKRGRESLFWAEEMRIIAFIDRPDVIEKILTHLGLWPDFSHAQPDGAVA